MRIVGDVGAKIRSLTLLEPWLITPASEKVKTQSFLNLAVDAKVFMHWRFGTGYLCPWTADFAKERRKSSFSLGAAVNGFSP